MGQMACRATADRSDGRDAELRRPAPRGAAGYDIQVADALTEAMGQQRALPKMTKSSRSNSRLTRWQMSGFPRTSVIFGALVIVSIPMVRWMPLIRRYPYQSRESIQGIGAGWWRRAFQDGGSAPGKTQLLPGLAAVPSGGALGPPVAPSAGGPARVLIIFHVAFCM